MNLDILKQAVMKLESAINDVCELKNQDIDIGDRELLENIADVCCTCEANLVNLYKKETGDDDLLYDNEEMLDIEEFPDVYRSSDMLDDSMSDDEI